MHARMYVRIHAQPKNMMPLDSPTEQDFYDNEIASQSITTQNLQFIKRNII